MIYLIMVVISTIAMPSCAVMDSDFHSARTKQAASPPPLQQAVSQAFKQAVSPPLTSSPTPDRAPSAGNGRRPLALYPLYGKQESSTFALEEHLNKDKIEHLLKKGKIVSRNRKFDHKGEADSERREGESLRSNRTFSVHQLRLRPPMKSYHRRKTLVTPALDKAKQKRSSPSQSIKIQKRKLFSVVNKVENSSIGDSEEDGISDDKIIKELYDSRKQTSIGPASLTVLADLHNLTRDVSRTISDLAQNGPNCDKVKRSADSQKVAVEVPGASGLQKSPVSLLEASEDTGVLRLENPDHSLVASNDSDSGNVTKATRRGTRRRRGRRRQQQSKTLALWIDQQQVKLFSGYMMEIFVIHDGKVLPYILDPNFEKHLPVIPYEVQRVNFTWQAGRKRYYYTFDRLYSHNPEILEAPVVSLPPTGRIPRKPKVFTVNLFCYGNASGIASFDIGLLIQTQRGKPLAGTPLRLKLRKECTESSVDPECDEKCENGGVCDVGRKCQCPEGYMGPYCNTALCYPQCMNGGTCTTPGRCTCPPGYQGRHCEGGICRDKCENGGKCVQKDTCACSKGYYGNRCEFSKCVIPCINGGRCRNVNKCRCPRGFAGDHCEVVTGHNVGAISVARCSRKCRHGSCTGIKCTCEEGFTGKWCRRRGTSRKRIWM
ncbi:uncharacterized protein [Palaemon carinicauda]|uniref:uncharacterized protein isoform X2 n=1 Tax=Palaemon carinicauda TaxID=392227 RepID=UPI0035B60BC6